MGLFDFFKKKEVVVNTPIEETKKDESTKQADIPIQETKKDEQPIKNVEIPVEEKKEILSNTIAITNVDKSIINEKAKGIIVSSELIEEVIYDFNGINYNFLDKLYFVDELQKNKVIKFIEKIIIKFKFKDIKSQKDYFKFEDNHSKYWDFVDNYEDVYTDTNGLVFPYFDYSNYVSWSITRIWKSKDQNGIISEHSRDLEPAYEIVLNTDMCVFNIRNKMVNDIKDIDIEEKTIVDFFNKSNFKYHGTVHTFNCLFDFYFKYNNIDKVNYYLDLLINITDSTDRHNIEKFFEYLISLAEKQNNYNLALEYTNKGIAFIKTHFPTSQSKTMGGIYKKLVQLLFEQKEYVKALEIINEAKAYNENLSFKQIQAKIEKELAK